MAATPDKRFVVDELLKGVMAQINFVPSQCHPIDSDSPDETSPEEFIITCIEVQSDNVMSLAFDKLVGNRNGGQDPAFAFMRTLSQLEGKNVDQNIALKCQPCVIRLVSTASNLVFDMFDAKPSGSKASSLERQFLQIASSFDVFFTRYVSLFS